MPSCFGCRQLNILPTIFPNFRAFSSNRHICSRTQSDCFFWGGDLLGYCFELMFLESVLKCQQTENAFLYVLVFFWKKEGLLHAQNENNQRKTKEKPTNNLSNASPEKQNSAKRPGAGGGKKIPPRRPDFWLGSWPDFWLDFWPGCRPRLLASKCSFAVSTGPRNTVLQVAIGDLLCLSFVLLILMGEQTYFHPAVKGPRSSCSPLLSNSLPSSCAAAVPRSTCLG